MFTEGSYERSALLQDMGLYNTLQAIRPRVALFGGTSNWTYQEHRTNLLCVQLHKDIETAKYWMLTAEGKEWKKRRTEKLTQEAKTAKDKLATLKANKVQATAVKKQEAKDAKKAAEEVKKDEKQKREASERFDLPVRCSFNAYCDRVTCDSVLLEACLDRVLRIHACCWDWSLAICGNKLHSSRLSSIFTGVTYLCCTPPLKGVG